MGEVVAFPTSYEGRDLGYRELAMELGCSVRWLRYQKKNGMPDRGLGYDRRRKFNLSEVQQWLEHRDRKQQ